MKPPKPMVLDLAKYDPHVQSLIVAARQTLQIVFRGATETFDPQANLLGFSYGAGYKGTVATLIVSRVGVKIGIPYGSLLSTRVTCLLEEERSIATLRSKILLS